MIKELNEPKYATLISKVITDLFWKSRDDGIADPLSLEDAIMEYTEKYIYAVDGFADEPTEPEILEAYKVVSTVVKIQNASVPLTNFLGSLKEQVDTVNITDTIMCGIYSAAFINSYKEYNK